MKFNNQLVARGFTNLTLIDSDSGSSGSWIEWESETYVGQRNGNWHKILVRDVDNPYKGHASGITVEEYPITAQEAAQLGATTALSPVAATQPPQPDKSQII